MEASGLVVMSCEELRKPIFSEVELYGFGVFSNLVEKIGTDICTELSTKGHISSIMDYLAITQHDGNIVYFEDNPPKESEYHEEFHVLLKKTKIKNIDFKGPSKGYQLMFLESAATAVEDYKSLKVSCEEKVKDLIKLRREFGKKTYNFAKRCLEDKLKEIPEQEIKEFTDRNTPKRRAKNWASMMFDLTYTGFIDPCHAILENFGLEQGQKELINLIRNLRDDSTAETFFKELRSKSGQNIEKIQPLRENLVIKGRLEYLKDENNFLKITFSNLRGYDIFPEIRDRLVNKYGKELEILGERFDLWASEEIILSGYI